MASVKGLFFPLTRLKIKNTGKRVRRSVLLRRTLNPPISFGIGSHPATFLLPAPSPGDVRSSAPHAGGEREGV